MPAAAAVVLEPESRDFYIRSMALLAEADVPFLVGGAYAFARYTGIERHTKDFDVFLRRSDFGRAIDALAKAGYRTEVTFDHWIGKAFQGEDFVDLIYGSGNGVAHVDDLWFKHAVQERVFGVEVLLIPPEEMIWSKGLIMERERFDGADVAHVINSVGSDLDWHRLIFRYGKHWRVLFAHLVLFGFIYPSRRSNVPRWVMEDLSNRMARELPENDSEDKTCYGTIISRQQYLPDVHKWGFRDARLKPIGNMSAKEIAEWTKGIDVDGTR